MKFIIAISLALLAACSSTPPLPKQPDESHRVPLNKPVAASADVVSTAP